LFNIAFNTNKQPEYRAKQTAISQSIFHVKVRGAQPWHAKANPAVELSIT